MTTALEQAVEVFKHLGWADAAPDDALTLPLGTAEQKRTAVAGLRSGAWGHIAEVSPHTWGWVSAVDVDEAMLSLFAIRVGVDARRAAAVLKHPTGAPDDLLTGVVASRGTAFASNFITAACVSRRRLLEHSVSTFGGVVVRLVALLDLPVPDNVEYLKDWTAYATVALGQKADLWRGDPGLPAEVIRERFIEHVRAGVATGVPSTGPFGLVVPAGVTAGWLARDEAVDLAFAGMDAAIRPGDRQAWVDVLDKLGVSDDELLARADALVPLLTTGKVVERIAPVLIRRADDVTALDTLIVALTTPTKKTLRVVLEAALARPSLDGLPGPSSCVQSQDLADTATPLRSAQHDGLGVAQHGGIGGWLDGADALEPQLAALTTNTDKRVAGLARQLIERWGLDALALDVGAPVTRGLWQPTPPLWQLPRFDHGPETPEALTDLAAELIRRPDGAIDVVTERFLAVANAVARHDLSTARQALQGVDGRNASTGLFPVADWVAGRDPQWGLDVAGWEPAGVMMAREFAVFQHLGEMPCLLSEPSFDDLSVTADDLVNRLQAYQTVGAACVEADFLLALMRVDPTTATPTLVTRLEGLAVAIVLQSGRRCNHAAGPTAAAYLANPIREPDVTIDRYFRATWRVQRYAWPASLQEVPNRHVSDLFTAFPHWGDASLHSVAWGDYPQQHQGVLLRQVVRRAKPLPPGGAINLLAVQRSAHPVAAADCALAVTEAWQRGLLQPGVADVTHLDWACEPSNLATLAAALGQIAEEQLLSVVWPILDDVVAASLRAPRLLAGTAEIVDTMTALLPEVQDAVATGRAESTVLDVPAVRALAARTGNARAVEVARRIAAQLPAVVVTQTVTEPADAPLDLPFDVLWPAEAGTLPAIDDGVTVTAHWKDATAPTPVLRFELTLPDGRVFQVDQDGWVYDLQQEGQRSAHTVDDTSQRVWLHWDADQGKVVVEAHRNWPSGEDGPLRGVATPPLSNALVTVAVGQIGVFTFYGTFVLESLMKDNLIGWAGVQAAARALLKCPDVSPSKLVAPLEKHPELLPVAWPLLTESVAAGAAQPGTPPAWLNRVLSVALQHSRYLLEAARRGYLPADAAAWPGLADLAARPGKSASIAKAKALAAALRP